MKKKLLVLFACLPFSISLAYADGGHLSADGRRAAGNTITSGHNNPDDAVNGKGASAEQDEPRTAGHTGADALFLKPDLKNTKPITASSQANTDTYFYYYADLDVTNKRELLCNLEQIFHKQKTKHDSDVGLHKALVILGNRLDGLKSLLIENIINRHDYTDVNAASTSAPPAINSRSAVVDYNTFPDGLGMINYAIVNANGATGTPQIKLRIKIRAYAVGVGSTAQSSLSLVDTKTGRSIALKADTAW